MHHHGPGIRRVAGFDASQEGQDGSGILGHAVVRPGHELKLPQLSFLARAVLQKETMKFKRDVIGKEKKKKKKHVSCRVEERHDSERSKALR